MGCSCNQATPLDGAWWPRPADRRPAFAVWEFIAGPLVENPQRVAKQLISPPFQGDWSARRGHYRVRYQIDDEKHAITVIDIADRSDIYHPGRK
jgi:mRNA interferase RelE/StbE